MRIVYIAHPIGGTKEEIRENIKKVKKILRELNLTNNDIVPFAHYLVDMMVLDDNKPNERERGILNDHYLMRKGFIDELWLFGNRISKGMKAEILTALEIGIPVICKTEETKRDLGGMLLQLSKIFFDNTEKRYEESRSKSS